MNASVVPGMRTGFNSSLMTTVTMMSAMMMKVVVRM
jgi:hypothetical protein